MYLFVCGLVYLQKCQGYIEDHADALRNKEKVSNSGCIEQQVSSYLEKRAELQHYKFKEIDIKYGFKCKNWIF